MIKSPKDPSAKIHVCWHQGGEWGGKGFSGHLAWEPVKKQSLSNFFANDESEPIGYKPILHVEQSDKNSGWAGMRIEPRSEWIGKYAEGYDHPLSGKYYSGNQLLGDSPSALAQNAIPSEVFAGVLGYLQMISDGEQPSKGQRELAIEVIRIRNDGNGQYTLYPAGASLLEWAGITKDEREELAGGKVDYA